MANEITASFSLALSRATPPETALWSTGPVALNQTGSRTSRSVQNVGTTAVAMQVVGGVVGYVAIQSLDTTTNGMLYILGTAGATTGAALMQLAPLEIAMFKAGGGLQAPYLIAATTGAQVEVMMFEL